MVERFTTKNELILKELALEGLVEKMKMHICPTWNRTDSAVEDVKYRG